MKVTITAETDDERAGLAAEDMEAVESFEGLDAFLVIARRGAHVVSRSHYGDPNAAIGDLVAVIEAIRTATICQAFREFRPPSMP